jgi:hypothetical protein
LGKEGAAALGATFNLTEDLKAGDKLTFANGGSAGELFIQYAAGATAGDIQKMINNAPNVQASLKSGVSASDVIPNLPSGATYAFQEQGIVNKYTSGATAQQVIDLINSKLGDVFTASALKTEGGTNGRVSYMDASVVYGDFNLDNALRFDGMDNGPLVRLSNLNSDGSKAINQELGIRIVQPSDADIRSGITTPILEIQLATDASGNSITTAKDIVDMFSKLNASETMGVSASLVYPPGVDPNGRVWVTDGCGKAYPLKFSRDKGEPVNLAGKKSAPLVAEYRVDFIENEVFNAGKRLPAFWVYKEYREAFRGEREYRRRMNVKTPSCGLRRVAGAGLHAHGRER